MPALTEWAAQSEKAGVTRALNRRDRVRLYFGSDGAQWDEERVLDRYELLYEAGLIEEARRDGRPAALVRKTLPSLGEPMRFDHRRIVHRNRASSRRSRNIVPSCLNFCRANSH